MTDAGRMEWDVKVHKAVSCRGAWGGRFLQALNALDSYWHGEGIRCFFQGSVTLDGVAYEVEPETSYGYADKHWGRSFNRPWFQFACGKLLSQQAFPPAAAPLRAGHELSASAFPTVLPKETAGAAADLHGGRFRVLPL